MLAAAPVGAAQRLAAIDRSLTKGVPAGPRRWYINSQGQTLVIIPPGVFQRGEGPGPVDHPVDHTLAVAETEVSVTEFKAFKVSYRNIKEFGPTQDCPVHEVSWYDAAAYCNWLSEQEGIPKDEWCYVPNENGEYAAGMKVVPDFQHRLGYRLPTAEEWEYACRAGGVTRWSIGEAEELVAKYAWCVVNSSSRSHPVATLRRTTWASSTCTATSGSGARTRPRNTRPSIPGRLGGSRSSRTETTGWRTAAGLATDCCRCSARATSTCR